MNLKSNSHSFCKCVDIASKFDNNDIVFFLEDDYLFIRNTVLSEIAAGMSFLRDLNDGKYVGLMPDDYPDRYVNNTANTSIVCTPIGHFMKIYSTTCTFITYCGAIK